jgi:hypothetical protein
MKKLILAALLLSSVSYVAYSAPVKYVYVKKDDGRHIPASEVPDAVKKSFHSRYPNAKNVRWEVDREDGGRVYEAEFTLNGRHVKAEFAPNGTFLGQSGD